MVNCLSNIHYPLLPYKQTQFVESSGVSSEKSTLLSLGFSWFFPSHEVVMSLNSSQ